MKLGELLNLQKSGALKVEHEEGSETATIGGTVVTLEQANKLCKHFGWKEYYLSAFDIISKTNSLIKNFRKSEMGTSWSTELWNSIDIEFQNKRGNTYGRTFDRIVMYIKGKKYTVIHGMENMGASYVVYVNGSAIPSAKCRTLNKVAEFLVSSV